MTGLTRLNIAHDQALTTRAPLIRRSKQRAHFLSSSRQLIDTEGVLSPKHIKVLTPLSAIHGRTRDIHRTLIRGFIDNRMPQNATPLHLSLERSHDLLDNFP